MHDSKTGSTQQAGLLVMGAAYQGTALQLLNCARQAVANGVHKNQNQH